MQHELWDTLLLRTQLYTMCNCTIAHRSYAVLQPLGYMQQYPEGWRRKSHAHQNTEAIKTCLFSASQGVRKKSKRWLQAATHKPPVLACSQGSKGAPPKVRLAVSQALPMPSVDIYKVTRTPWQGPFPHKPF